MISRYEVPIAIQRHRSRFGRMGTFRLGTRRVLRDRRISQRGSFTSLPERSEPRRYNEGGLNDFKERYGAVDVIVGGSPCQSFSIAGGRAGLDGESRLMFEYIRAVSEIRPTWFLWENVPGVFSTDAGRAFGILLHEMEELGYGMAWRVLDAQYFGVAQRRKRVFLIGYLGNGGIAAAVLFESDSVSGNTLTSREKRESLTRAASIGIESGSSTTIAIQGSMLGRSDKNGPQGCGLSEEISFTLNTVDRHGVICMADDTSNAAVDINLSGTLKVGGGFH